MSNVMTTDRRPSETRFRRPVSVLPLGLPRIFQRNRAVEHGLALLTLFAAGNEDRPAVQTAGGSPQANRWRPLRCRRRFL